MTMLALEVEKRLGDFSLAAGFSTAGGVTALFGPSGAGKTTLANMIAGLIAPDRGRIVLDETVLFDSAARCNVPAHRRRIGYVFQEGRLFPHLSVAGNLDYGRWMCGLAPDAAELKRIVDLLDIGHLLARRPGKLSGGERQRVAIARAIVGEPSLVLADEPTGNLDSHTGADIIDAFRDLHAAGSTIVLITHETALSASLPRCVSLLDGRIVDDSERAAVAG